MKSLLLLSCSLFFGTRQSLLSARCSAKIAVEDSNKLRRNDVTLYRNLMGAILLFIFTVSLSACSKSEKKIEIPKSTGALFDGYGLHWFEATEENRAHTANQIVLRAYKTDSFIPQISDSIKRYEDLVPYAQVLKNCIDTTLVGKDDTADEEKSSYKVMDLATFCMERERWIAH